MAAIEDLPCRGVGTDGYVNEESQVTWSSRAMEGILKYGEEKADHSKFSNGGNR